MHSVRAGLWDPRLPSEQHASPHSNLRFTNVTSATPAKRITFYKSGDSQFGGIRMAVHKRSFKCFDTLLDDLSQKMPLPFGVRTVTTPRGTHTIQHLEQLQDGGCYLCSDRRQAKPINIELAGKRPNAWYHHGHRPHPPEASSATPPGHLPFRQRRILLVKNSEPGMRRSVMLSRRSARSLRSFLNEASDVMQFHVRKFYTAEGRRIDSLQNLLACPGVLVCVGREAFSPMLVNLIRKSSEEKLPTLSSKSPGLGPRTPGNGARSPTAPGVRSTPHGSQSRASENSEGQESKKSVNFGLETKKSIIHPRSDSSNRSTHFSMSSEKSYGVSAYSHARPTITNEDIEKRVLVNKDGSLSLEMRVRFRLQNDETLQWSTQVKKSPSLTNECCPLSQSQPYYLQQGQSESCSDSASFDYSNQRPQSVSEGVHCSCCHQRREREYDLWENPAHSRKQCPVPPPHASGSPHSKIRDTRSSSSSSSCNSRRVVRCRARLSKCRGGSGPNQLVQEEMCVMEQVERRVEVEQDGDTHVEVHRVSRSCSRSEVVAIDDNLRPLEDELMTEEPGERSLSAISSSSNVLQSLREDPDDDFPFSTSQCCNCNEPSPSPTAEGEPKGKEDSDISTGSVLDRASCRSNKASDDEDEEIKRVASGLSNQMRLSASSVQSRASSVCLNCGGCKYEIDSVSSSRASQADHSRRASPKPATPLSTATTGKEEERASCAASTTSHRSKRSHKSGCNCDTGLTAEGERSPSATSAQSSKSHAANRAASPDMERRQEAAGEIGVDRPPSSLSAKSGAAEEDDTNKRAPSTLSGSLGISVKSDKVERPDSVLSAKSTKSNVSAMSSMSHRSTCSHFDATQEPVIKITGQEEGTQAEDGPRAESAKSNKSTKSNKSHKSKEASEASGSPKLNTGRDLEKRAESQTSNRSVKSNISVKSCQSSCHVETPIVREVQENENGLQEEAKSQKSNLSTASPNPSEAEEPSTETNAEAQSPERAVSALSVKSKSSVRSTVSNKSHSSKNIRSESPYTNITIKTPVIIDEDGNERLRSSASAQSGKSRVSVGSSQKSNNDRAADVETDTDETEVTDYDTKSKCSEQSRGQSLSPTRARSPRKRSVKDPAQSTGQQLMPSVSDARGPSALSVHSSKSAKSGRSKCCCVATSGKEKQEDKEEKSKEGNDVVKNEEASEQASSVRSLSTKSKRRGSGGTEQTLSRKSSGSVSLGLPEDQETAESDSGKSSVSFHVNNQRGKTASSDVTNCSAPPDAQGNVEETESAMSQKSNIDITLSHNLPAIDIPKIETPNGSNENWEGSGRQKSRAGSALSAKSSRSHKSTCSCSIKAAALAIETGSTKSNNDSNRTLSAMSSASPSVCCKSPERVSVKKSNVIKLTPESSANDTETQTITRPASQSKREEDVPGKKELGVQTKSPCCLRPKSATSALSGSLNSNKDQKTKSKSSAKTSKSEKRAIKAPSPCFKNSSRPHSKAETCSESTLSHSLSAADLLKETMTTERLRTKQSKSSKTSEKSWSEKRQSENQPDPELPDLTPACLPNASPNEVVSDWLRSIPANSGMLGLGDELHEDEEKMTVEKSEGEAAKEEEESPEDEKVEKGEKTDAEQVDEKEEAGCDATDPAPVNATETPSHPKALLLNEPLPKNWDSSAAVMKVLLSSSTGRCRSMPEVSPVYGRRLSTSARGFLDCLAQLQLIEPVVSSGFDQQKNRRFEDIIAILQSLWLTGPRETEAKESKDIGKEQVTPPRSSSGVDMSSGSGGSGKENGNGSGDGKAQNKTTEVESLHEDEHGKQNDNEIKAEAEDLAKTTSSESPKATENPSSSDKSSAPDSSKSPTDNEQEAPEDTSSGTPSTVLQAPLSKKLPQDPDPVWILQLLKKVEKQFMSHYSNAMAEFKVRWDLDDSLILDTMIAELRDEVSRRIQSSIEREMKKIHSRVGKTGKSAQMPKRANLSRDSTMTEKRRQMLRVMKNQSVKTADSVSDVEMAGDFSDQRSEDEYCPCEACVRKKMAARPLKVNPLAAEAPVMMEFDLLKILQRKKSPPPSVVPPPVEEKSDKMASDEEGRNLEVVQEEEEEESKEGVKADVVLEETSPELDEEMEKDGGEGGGKEEISVSDEEDEGLCHCQCAKNEEEQKDVGEGEGETTEGEDTMETTDDTAEGETGESGEAGPESNPEEEEEQATENEDDDAARKDSNHQDLTEEDEDAEKERERETSEEERASARGQGVTEGEEADGEDSDAMDEGTKVTGSKKERDVEEEEEVLEETAEIKPEEGEVNGEKSDECALLHQFTRTSVESQPGSLEDNDTDSPPNPVRSVEASKLSAGGGAGQRRSRSPARVKRSKPKECDEELDF